MLLLGLLGKGESPFAQHFTREERYHNFKRRKEKKTKYRLNPLEGEGVPLLAYWAYRGNRGETLSPRKGFSGERNAEE